MPRFLINFYSGIFYRRDAISNSVLDKYRVVKMLQDGGTALDCRIFTHATDHGFPELIVVRTAAQAIAHPAFHAAGLHVYEFGVYYDLFNAIMLKTDARKFVFYHNFTPGHLVEEDRARVAVERAQIQFHNLWEADRIVCISEFSRRELLSHGFEPDRLSVIHLPPAVHTDSAGRSFHGISPGEPIRLLFVGRFTAAKGVLDLVRAIALLKRDGFSAVRLELVGAMRFSDPAFIATLSALIESENVTELVRLTGELSDEELAAAYGRADIFVMPSLHEGYCVPLVEAMSAGCFPIVYDAGNLPYLMSGLGLLTPAGDVAALASRIGDVAKRLLAARGGGAPLLLRTECGAMSESEWRAAVERHVADYSRDAYNRQISELFLAEMGCSRREPEARQPAAAASR